MGKTRLTSRGENHLSLEKKYALKGKTSRAGGTQAMKCHYTVFHHHTRRRKQLVIKVERTKEEEKERGMST